jgi:hypothetical protein
MQAANGEVEQNPVSLIGLDVGREDARRRLGGAHTDGSSAVDNLDRRPAARKFVRDGTPNDPGTDDDDVGWTRHGG